MVALRTNGSARALRLLREEVKFVELPRGSRFAPAGRRMKASSLVLSGLVLSCTSSSGETPGQPTPLPQSQGDAGVTAGTGGTNLASHAGSPGGGAGGSAGSAGSAGSGGSLPLGGAANGGSAGTSGCGSSASAGDSDVL